MKPKTENTNRAMVHRSYLSTSPLSDLVLCCMLLNCCDVSTRKYKISDHGVFQTVAPKTWFLNVRAIDPRPHASPRAAGTSSVDHFQSSSP